MWEIRERTRRCSAYQTSRGRSMLPLEASAGPGTHEGRQGASTPAVDRDLRRPIRPGAARTTRGTYSGPAAGCSWATSHEAWTVLGTVRRVGESAAPGRAREGCGGPAS